MQHPDEGMIHTWLDGQLPAEESAALEAHVATCEQCAAAVAEARGFMAGASRIVSALDIVPGGVIPIAKPKQRAWYESTQFRAAAAVLVVAGASLLLVKKENQTQLVPAPVSARMAEKTATPSAQTAGDAPSTAAATLASPARQTEDRATSVAPVAPSVGPLAKAPTVAAAKANQNAAVKEPSIDAAARRDEVARVTAKAFERRRASDAASSSIETVVVASPELRLTRVDSARTPRQSFYATATGSTLVLTEIDSPGFAVTGRDAAAPAPARKTMGAPRNAPATTRVMSPPTAPVLDPMIPFPAGGAAQSAAKATINTIIWFDATGLRRYILSGPVPVAELEAAKVFLQKAQQ